MKRNQIDEIFGLDEKNKQIVRDHLRKLGIPEEKIKECVGKMHLIHEGKTFGHA